MSLSKETQTFSHDYQTSLLERFNPQIVDDLINNWSFADLPDQPGERIPYVRLNQGASEKAVIYIPGFTEGIKSKAPFAAELAQLGFDVILPDQNRKGVLRNPGTNHKDATYSQAVNYLAVLQSEHVSEVDVVSHSYGSLIFDSMFKIAKQRHDHYFDESKVIMLAPAGFNKEKLLNLGYRFVSSIRSEGKDNPKSFPDHLEMLLAGVRNFIANIPRTAREVYSLKKHEVDYPTLLNGLGSLSVLSYACDRLYPQELLAPMIRAAVENGVNWAVPITPGDNKLHSTHNDEQFNPIRVAASVAQLLQ